MRFLLKRMHNSRLDRRIDWWRSEVAPIQHTRRVVNRTKPNQKSIEINSIEPYRSDWCSIGSAIEHNRTGTFWWVPLPNSIEPIELNRFCLTERQNASSFNSESERSPFSMYLKQFENKNISINPELTKILIVLVIQKW